MGIHRNGWVFFWGFEKVVPKCNKTHCCGLCNLSIISEKFSDICKVGKLKPLYKRGFLTKPCNFRPLSLLPLIFKVIEQVIQGQTSTFLNSEILLYIYQSGFWKKHSIDFCLSYLNDKILKGFDKGVITGMVLIDLQKAFERLTMVCYCKNYTLLVSWNILLIGLSLISSSDIF